jgi:hypothetical protein
MERKNQLARVQSACAHILFDMGNNELRHANGKTVASFSFRETILSLAAASI